MSARREVIRLRPARSEIGLRAVVTLAVEREAVVELAMAYGCRLASAVMGAAVFEIVEGVRLQPHVPMSLVLAVERHGCCVEVHVRYEDDE